MNVDPDTIRLFSQHLMAVGFAAALIGMLSIRRFGFATIFLIALIETYVAIRYPLHGVVRDYLLDHGHDAAVKTALQMRLLIGGAVGGGLVTLALVPFLVRASVAMRLIVAGVLVILAMLGVELVSLHWVDAVIYRPAGPVARCAIVYFIGAMLATCGALVERRRQARFSFNA